MGTLYWTLDRCKEDALKYKSKSEWRRKSNSSYVAASKYNYTNECSQHMKRPEPYNKMWTLETCKKDALKYKSKSEWQDKSKGAYWAACTNKWLNECCNHMKRPKHWRLTWTLELCKADALKYKTRTEWQKKSSGYKAARKNNWLDQCCAHMKILHQVWTLEDCKKDALKYKTRTEWARKSKGKYLSAMRKKKLDVCCEHMKPMRLPNNYWTLERCKEDALKYKSIISWRKNSKTAYHTAHENKWIEECCAHIKRIGGTSEAEKELINMLKQEYPKIQKNVRFNTKNYFKDKPYIKRFELDIYIPELRKGVEFNGTYWHSFEGLKRGRSHWLNDEDIKNYHNLKKEFFKSKNIDYIEILQIEWNKDPDKCINECLQFLGADNGGK